MMLSTPSVLGASEKDVGCCGWDEDTQIRSFVGFVVKIGRQAFGFWNFHLVAQEGNINAVL